MTEAEWRAFENTKPMLEYLDERVSNRKLCLFAAWCCRTIWCHMEKSTLNSVWQTPSVLVLAQVYDNRILPAGTLEPVRLAVLADALEEAGCDNADILRHLREPGEHVRGCWVVDLILSKE
jgi:hypothetical protein